MPGVRDNAEVGELSRASGARLLRRGRLLEWVTLSWNVVAVVVLAVLAVIASSVALAGFGLDSVIEVGASAVVLWELSGSGARRQRLALRLIGAAFIALAAYLLVQSTVALATEHRADDSPGGIVWTAVTVVVMFTLAGAKRRTGRALGNAVLEAEARVTFIDGILAAAVLVGIALDAVVGWWWADAVVGYVIVFYAIREAVHIFGHHHAVG
jgi:divalent metal cation (Fe/Co/Zn/Cd) transporter